MLKKINTKKSLAETVADDINDLIVERELKPGDKLPSEPELMEALSVGRGTVREAVKILVSRNVLTIRRGVGTYVSENTGQIVDPFGFDYVEDKEKLLLDILELRGLIEPTMAGNAAENASDEEIDELQVLCDAIEKKLEKNQDHTKEDVEFHTLIAKCSHNMVISNLIPIINEGVSKAIALTHSALKDETIATHRKIMQGIQHHDRQEAYEAMKEHIYFNQRVVQEALKANVKL